MSAQERVTQATDSAFDETCRCLAQILDSDRRREILQRLGHQVAPLQMLQELKTRLQTHRLRASDAGTPIARWIRPLELQTIEDGFHVLQDWDGQLERLNSDIIPVDVLQFLIDTKPLNDPRVTAAIVVDYYFLYTLALLVMRIWNGDANRNLERLQALLEQLQGPNGSGHRFVDNVESLILVATSHFESDETAFVRLRGRVATLNTDHRLNVALAVAPIFASHLRFGYQATYGRDLVAMRKDNAPDYPWLLFALRELAQSYEQDHQNDRRISEALVNGLTPDPKAFLGKTPAILDGFRDEADDLKRLVRSHRDQLTTDIDSHLPTEERYSPLAFFFNFPHNLLKAMVVDAASIAQPNSLSLNDLLTTVPQQDDLNDARTRLVATLTGYASKNPDRIRGRLTPVIVYDHRRGRRAFADARKVLVALGEQPPGDKP